MEDKIAIILEYSVVYPGESEPNVDDIIMHMSRHNIVNLVLVLTELYSSANISQIARFFSDQSVLNEIYSRIFRYCNPYQEYIFLPLQTALRILRRAVALPYVAEDRLSSETELDLFKVILYINEQETKVDNMPRRLPEMVFVQSVVMYTSNATSAFHKERALLQAHASFEFFKFIESKIADDDNLKQIYDAFLQQYGIDCGLDYILTLFGICAMGKMKVGRIPLIDNDPDRILSRSLIDALSLDLMTQISDTSSLGRDNNADYRTFRNKPFICDINGGKVVYWMEALIDRMYNSLYFDFIDIKQRLHSDYPLRELFTNDFAEKYLFQRLMSRANEQLLYKAKYNAPEHENGRADYVLTRNYTTILFECKDIKILGEIVESHDARLILDEYKNKLYMETYETRQGGCREPRKNPRPKGVGQLIEYMKQVRNGEAYYEVNRDCTLYPVLVLLDSKLLQRGFQEIADGWYEERENKTENDKPLIVMSFITLIKSYPLFARNGFEHYFDGYRDFISSIKNPIDLQKYMTFDDYMEAFGEPMDIDELRKEFMDALTMHYKQKKH